MKLRIKENLRALISKMPIIFFKFQPKDTQIQYFPGKSKFFSFYVKICVNLILLNY